MELNRQKRQEKVKEKGWEEKLIHLCGFQGLISVSARKNRPYERISKREKPNTPSRRN